MWDNWEIISDEALGCCSSSRANVQPTKGSFRNSQATPPHRTKEQNIEALYLYAFKFTTTRPRSQREMSLTYEINCLGHQSILSNWFKALFRVSSRQSGTKGRLSFCNMPPGSDLNTSIHLIEYTFLIRLRRLMRIILWFGRNVFERVGLCWLERARMLLL